MDNNYNKQDKYRVFNKFETLRLYRSIINLIYNHTNMKQIYIDYDIHIEKDCDNECIYVSIKEYNIHICLYTGVDIILIDISYICNPYRYSNFNQKLIFNEREMDIRFPDEQLLLSILTYEQTKYKDIEFFYSTLINFHEDIEKIYFEYIPSHINVIYNILDHNIIPNYIYYKI